MKYILIGAGSRGMIYGSWAHDHNIEIAAIAELRPDRLEAAGRALNVPENRRFVDTDHLFALGKIADAAIIATMDRDHYGHVMAALDCGYDILLEKPISPDPRECLEIEAKANALGRKITVCHVLRYTNFFSTTRPISVVYRQFLVHRSSYSKSEMVSHIKILRIYRIKGFLVRSCKFQPHMLKLVLVRCCKGCHIRYAKFHLRSRVDR